MFKELLPALTLLRILTIAPLGESDSRAAVRPPNRRITDADEEWLRCRSVSVRTRKKVEVETHDIGPEAAEPVWRYAVSRRRELPRLRGASIPSPQSGEPNPCY